MNLGPLQATVPPLSQEARSQQVWIEGEIEVQTALSVPQLVEDSIQVLRSLRGFPALYAASMVRQEVGQEVTSGIHSSRVNHFILRQILQGSPCQSHGGKRRRVIKSWERGRELNNSKAENL